MPNDFYAAYPRSAVTPAARALSALGSLGDYDGGAGIFRGSGTSFGGGLFNRNLAGLGASVDLPDPAGIQKGLNVMLDAAGYCPITVDGKIGPGSCAAATAIGHPLAVNCKLASITGGSPPPKKPNCAAGGGGGGGGGGGVTPALPPYQPPMQSGWKPSAGLIAFGVGGVAALVVGLVVLKKKRAAKAA